MKISEIEEKLDYFKKKYGDRDWNILFLLKISKEITEMMNNDGETSFLITEVLSNPDTELLNEEYNIITLGLDVCK